MSPVRQALLQELLDQTEGNPEAPGDFFAVALTFGPVKLPRIRSRKSNETVRMKIPYHSPAIMATVLFKML